MRMQLALKIKWIPILICLPVFCAAQQGPSQGRQEQSFPKKELDDTEINFLLNYYEQDGDHAAVTGGRGTQKLDNIAPAFIINIPLDTNKVLNIYTGVDIYSSASTDNIDFNVSSASGQDARIYLNATYTVKNSVKNTYLSFIGGVSTEYDYNSLSAGIGWTKLSKDENRELRFTGKVYFDRWTLIYPVELRNADDLLNEDRRRSYNFSMTYSQVINRKLQTSISTDLVYQSGLLSTPFHRVFFQNNDNATIERLPDHRFKIPVGVRLNYYLSDLIIARLFYRYYYDDFGITANTFSIELPIKASAAFTFYPLYRYHTQTAADYFQPFDEHLETALFYTSDFDLSGFASHKIGLGIRYSPLYGVTRFRGLFAKKKNRITQLKSIDLRYANYARSDGLDANLVSMDFAFKF